MIIILFYIHFLKRKLSGLMNQGLTTYLENREIMILEKY